MKGAIQFIYSNKTVACLSTFTWLNCLPGCWLDFRYFEIIFRCTLILSQHSQGQVGEQVGSGVGGVGWEVAKTTIKTPFEVCSYEFKKHQPQVQKSLEDLRCLTGIKINFRHIFNALYRTHYLSCDFAGSVKFTLENQISQLSVTKALCMGSI